MLVKNLTPLERIALRSQYRNLIEDQHLASMARRKLLGMEPAATPARRAA